MEAGAGFGEFTLDGGFAAGTTSLDGAVVACEVPLFFREAGAGLTVDGFAGIAVLGVLEATEAAWSFAVEEFLGACAAPAAFAGFGVVVVVEDGFTAEPGLAALTAEPAGAFAGGLSGTEGRRSARISAAR